LLFPNTIMKKSEIFGKIDMEGPAVYQLIDKPGKPV